MESSKLSPQDAEIRLSVFRRICRGRNPFLGNHLAFATLKAERVADERTDAAPLWRLGISVREANAIIDKLRAARPRYTIEHADSLCFYIHDDLTGDIVATLDDTHANFPRKVETLRAQAETISSQPTVGRAQAM